MKPPSSYHHYPNSIIAAHLLLQSIHHHHQSLPIFFFFIIFESPSYHHRQRFFFSIFYRFLVLLLLLAVPPPPPPPCLGSPSSSFNTIFEPQIVKTLFPFRANPNPPPPSSASNPYPPPPPPPLRDASEGAIPLQGPSDFAAAYKGRTLICWHDFPSSAATGLNMIRYPVNPISQLGCGCVGMNLLSVTFL